MRDRFGADLSARPILDEMRELLVKAQLLGDSIDPNSIFGARLQQLIDELGDGGREFDVQRHVSVGESGDQDVVS